MFLDVSDLLNFLFTFFFLPDNQAQSHPNGTGIGHTPNPALLHSVLGLAQAILDIFQSRRIAVVRDREHRAEDRFEATPFVPLFRGNIALQKTLEGIQLDLQQIWNFNGRIDLPKRTPDTVSVAQRDRHEAFPGLKS